MARLKRNRDRIIDPTGRDYSCQAEKPAFFPAGPAVLPESVLQFPRPENLGGIMEAAGLRDVKWETLTGGIAAIQVVGPQ